MKIVVTGGGWSGCAAALSAPKTGADVTLLERTDMLLGTGLVGGIMRNNGRFTATRKTSPWAAANCSSSPTRTPATGTSSSRGTGTPTSTTSLRMEPMARSFLLSRGSASIARAVTDVEMADGAIRAVLAKQAEEP